MSDYRYWDEDVKYTVNQAIIGNADVEEIVFKEPIEAFNIHKDDIIYLARQFGLIVFERESEL